MYSHVAEKITYPYSLPLEVQSVFVAKVVKPVVNSANEIVLTEEE